MAQAQRFPIQTDDGDHHTTRGRSAVPWSFAEHVQDAYAYTVAPETPMSLDERAQHGGWGWSEMMEILVRAAEKRELDDNATTEDLSATARKAFNASAGAPSRTDRTRTGGAW